jgi:hypothetical protein
MSKTLAQIMAEMPDDERNEVEARGAEILAELDGLAELRRLANQIEKRADLYLSTLRRFVAAAGGELELRVSLPGKGTFKLTGVGELTA